MLGGEHEQPHDFARYTFFSLINLLKKNGSITLTHIHNKIGRIQSELIISKVKDNHYYGLSAALSEIRDLDWFNQNKLKDEKVDIKNITNEYGILGLIGPKSREVLRKITKENIENENFPWLKAKEIEINNIKVLALRVNYMGELGWELHVIMSKMEELYDLLMDAGQDLEIINFGSHAMNSMRIEKRYRGWGTELTPEISVVEAGLDRFFNLNKKNKFIGSEVINEKLSGKIEIKLVYLEVEAETADVLRNEPIHYNNKRVGLTTSGAYGFRINKSLAFVYINADLIKIGTEFLIDIQGKKITAKIIEEPAFDPKNLRLKS